jgi:UDP-N-acetylmuramyl pentapeptide phosphotransferase/UDP-N-acetylglucosamine-1-phosphate transferase
MLWLLFAFIGATVLSWGLTKLVLNQLQRRAILDFPNPRSSHEKPTPRGGGIAVVGVIVLCWVYPAADSPLLTTLLLGGLALALVSWLDDLHTMGIATRLCAQFLTVAAALYFLKDEGFLLQGLAPAWLDRIVTCLLWVWFINLFNFMDGIDGIAAVEAIIISGGLGGLYLTAPVIGLNPWLPLGIAGAALGFLWWNWHPAKLFLGDVGSVPLGYFLGGLLILTALKGFWLPALILPLYFLCDASVTLARRALRKEPVWQAHRQHFYQLAVQSGKRHSSVSGAVCLVGVVLVGLSLWSLTAPLPALGLAVGAVCWLLFWMAR